MTADEELSAADALACRELAADGERGPDGTGAGGPMTVALPAKGFVEPGRLHIGPEDRR
jgi:hypothetical protein